MRGYIGVDVGSVSTNLVLIGDDDVFIDSIYLRTRGNPIEAVKDGLRMLRTKHSEFEVLGGAGATGSGRKLAGVIVAPTL